MAIDIVKYIIDQATKTAGSLIDQAKETPGISEALEEAESRQQAEQPEPQQPVYQTPVRKKPVADDVAEEERKSVVVDDGRQPSLDEQAQQRYEDEAEDDGVAEQATLQPSVSTQGSQNLADLEREFQDWLDAREQRGVESNEQRKSDIERYNAGAGRDFAWVPDESKPTRPTHFDEDVNRRFFNPDGSMKNPLEWTLTGLTSQQKTPDAVRNIYDYYFDQEDRNGIRNEDAVSTKLTNEDQFGSVVRENLIDDGADPASREAMYMTGEQYLKYRNELGMPGRDTRYINPDEIYSKQDEMENYGFVPYLVSDEGYDRFREDANSAALSNVFNMVADARRNLTDYTLNFDGQQYSGKDFDKNIRLWNQRTENKKPELVYDQNDASEYAIPQALIAYDENGKRYIAPNRPTREPQENGTIRYRFNDNPDDDWVFDDEEDEKRSLAHEPAQENEYVAAWLNQEPLVLDDGRTIRADRAAELWRNEDQYADYGPAEIARPSVTDPFEQGGWAPWFVDMALSSSPYFFGPTATLKAAADATNNFQGMQPGYQDYLNGTYSLLSENPTREQQITATTGSAVMPVTERLWGPLGKAMFKTGPTEKLLQTLHVPETVTGRTVPRWIMGASDEGVEEIAGNLVEGYQQNGLSGWYANDRMLYDENGNPVLDVNGEQKKDVDAQGYLRKDENTSIPQRIRNFAEDAPLAYTGGFALGGVLGTPEIPSYYREYQQQQAERANHGYNATTPVDIDALINTRQYSDAERDYFNR